MAERIGFFIRLSADDRQRVQYWADRHGMSVTDYIAEAADEKIRRENLDYDLPNLHIARLNQLVDVVTGLSTNVANLQRTVNTGLGSLIGLAQGGNYLLEEHESDGEL